MKEKDIDFKDDFDDFFGDERVVTREPPRLDDSTFDKRNDPSPLLHQFKLNLLNAYEEEEVRITPKGDSYTVLVIKGIKGTRPKANKQGIEEIMRYMRTIINRHLVQANISNQQEFNKKMMYISKDCAIHFINNRRDWGISHADVDILISNAVNMFDLFLTRALENKEREGYTEGYKEITSKGSAPDKKKGAGIQSIANWFSR